MKKGDFLKVLEHIKVLAFLEGENKVSNNPLDIWYGEKSDKGNPKYRIIPIEYCEKIAITEGYD